MRFARGDFCSVPDILRFLPSYCTYAHVKLAPVCVQPSGDAPKIRSMLLNAGFHAHPNPSKHILVLLQIECPLVLQPSPIVLYRRDLLAVVIGNGILRTGRRGIGPVPLNAGVERFLLLEVKLAMFCPSSHISWLPYLRDSRVPALPPRPYFEYRRAKARSAQPSSHGR